jgi:hypothetical protein
MVPTIEKAVAEACGADKFAANMQRLNIVKVEFKRERKAIADAIDGGPIYEDHPLTGELVLVSPDSEDGKLVIKMMRTAARKGKELTAYDAMAIINARKRKRQEQVRLNVIKFRTNQSDNPAADAV